MNTPKPCGSCGFLYVDCMTEDDPNAGVECLKKMPFGNTDCPGYKHYDMVSQEEKWRS